jgi:hypothetical protein
MPLDTRFWLRISLFNLFIVALFGTVMRYKIGFEFPVFDQKHLQHAHSHFAFAGWVAQTLFVLMISVLQSDLPGLNTNRYRALLASNLAVSYGMLVSFAISGYSPVSIGLATASVIVSYLFAIFLFRDLAQVRTKVYANWFTASLWFCIISSIGTFVLAYMMATHNFNQNYHLASLYFYLHFQYNGFFTFACTGLFLNSIHLLFPGYQHSKWIFRLFFIACIPAYFLSVLWADLPVWLIVIVVIAACMQASGWFILMFNALKVYRQRSARFLKVRWIVLALATAITAKFILQVASTIPEVSNLAFGFRSIVIAYLHLVLLAIISVFILVFIRMFDLISINRMFTASLGVFATGVYLTEIVLGVQGIASFSYTPVPHVNGTLFFLAVLMLASVLGMILSQFRRGDQDRFVA